MLTLDNLDTSMKLNRIRSNYWSNSKLAKRILRRCGHPTPVSATAEDWLKINTDIKTKNPIVYWIVEELLDTLQNIVLFPADVYDAIRMYINNRYISQTHKIVTRLKPGQWHESDTRILYGLFQVLVDYVEVELSHMYYCCHPIEKPWYRRNLFRWNRYRDAENGLKYLEWEMSLVDESPLQAERAQQVLSLYRWWTETRPQRNDPFIESGLSAFYERQEGEGVMDMLAKTYTEEQHEQLKAMRELDHALERQYDDEDTAMLIQLINIRHSLWT